LFPLLQSRSLLKKTAKVTHKIRGQTCGQDFEQVQTPLFLLRKFLLLKIPRRTTFHRDFPRAMHSMSVRAMHRRSTALSVAERKHETVKKA
jgi:hypothetical protein